MKFYGSNVLITIAIVSILGFALTGCHCQSAIEGKLTLLSSKIGYKVEGPYGFTGTITKDNLNMEEWNFSGKFVFPNQWCFYLGKSITISESYPEQIIIRFYVITSWLGDLLVPQDKEVPVQFNIKASNDAQFRVIFH